MLGVLVIFIKNVIAEHLFHCVLAFMGAVWKKYVVTHQW